MMKEINVTVRLDAVWRKAEVDFQTFQPAHGQESELPDLTDALAVEPDLFSSEWFVRSSRLIPALGLVRRLDVRRDIFSADVLVPVNAPEGIGMVLTSLCEAYFVRSLLGAWSELRHEGGRFDWRTGAEEMIGRIGEILNSGEPEKPCPRRISCFP